MAEDLHARVETIRGHIRGTDPLPDWTPEQWLMVMNVKLGDAAYALHPHLFGAHGLTDANRAEGVECLLAVAAACLDAVESIEADARSGEPDDDRR